MGCKSAKETFHRAGVVHLDKGGTALQFAGGCGNFPHQEVAKFDACNRHWQATSLATGVASANGKAASFSADRLIDLAKLRLMLFRGFGKHRAQYNAFQKKPQTKLSEHESRYRVSLRVSNLVLSLHCI